MDFLQKVQHAHLYGTEITLFWHDTFKNRREWNSGMAHSGAMQVTWALNIRDINSRGIRTKWFPPTSPNSNSHLFTPTERSDVMKPQPRIYSYTVVREFKLQWLDYLEIYLISFWELVYIYSANVMLEYCWVSLWRLWWLETASISIGVSL